MTTKLSDFAPGTAERWHSCRVGYYLKIGEATETLSEIETMIANRCLEEATAELETILENVPDGAEIQGALLVLGRLCGRYAHHRHSGERRPAAMSLVGRCVCRGQSSQALARRDLARPEVVSALPQQVVRTDGPVLGLSARFGLQGRLQRDGVFADGYAHRDDVLRPPARTGPHPAGDGARNAVRIGDGT